MLRNKVKSDIIIFGGGISGLWLLNALSLRGLSCLLFEKNALGAGQTGQSQGIIHGGIKYSLHGLFDPSSRAIADMPKRWQQHLSGQSKINLSQVEILSRAHFLWSNQHLSNRITHFLASKTLSCPGTLIEREEYPAIFNHPEFQGYLTRVDETVINPISLIQQLAKPWYNHIFKCCSKRLPEFQLDDDGKIVNVTIETDDNQITKASARYYIFAAGEGNASLLQSFPNHPIMQTRPLHMVAVTLPDAQPLFAHYISADGQPTITITTHHDKKGNTVWYCGGNLAETGVNLTQPQQIETAKQYFKEYLPWVDVSQAHWHSFFINRAEISQPNKKRPVSFFAEKQKNYIVTWPTKLALTPAMSDHVIKIIQNEGGIAQEPDLSPLCNWPKPSLGHSYWDGL